MSVTVNLDLPRVRKIARGFGILTGTLNFSGTYSTGGVSITGVTQYFKSCKSVMCDAHSGYIFEFDRANSKLKIRYPTKSQSSNLALSAHSVTDTLAIAAGSTAVTSTAANGDIISGSITVADHSFSGTKGQVDSGVGEELANGTDISGITGVPFEAKGWV